MLVCAPPRSGKSILAMSQLLTWPHSVAVVDIKGELYRNTAGYRSTLGPVYVIDPEGYGDQYDPLHGLTDEDELYNVAKNLLFDPKEAEDAPLPSGASCWKCSSGRRVWNSTARQGGTTGFCPSPARWQS